MTRGSFSVCWACGTLLSFYVTLGLEDSAALSALEQTQAVRELSATQATVRAVLAGGDARRARENVEMNEFHASKLAAAAKHSALTARRAVAAAAYKNYKATEAGLAEVAQSAAASLRREKAQAEQSMREAKEAGIKHVLLVKLRRARLLAVAAEQKQMIEVTVLQTKLTRLKADANNGAAKDAAVLKKLNTVKTQRQGAERKLSKNSRTANAMVNAASQHSQAAQIAKAKMDGAKQAEVPVELAQETETEVPSIIAQEDVWGARKCSGWISKDIGRCKSPNYQFNCAKTCGQQRRANLVATAKDAVAKEYASAQAKAKAANEGATVHRSKLSHLQKQVSNSKEAEREMQQERVVTLVSEKKAKGEVSQQATKIHQARQRAALETIIVANIGQNIKLVQAAIDAATTGLKQRFGIMVGVEKKAAVDSVIQKGSNVGLLMAGTKQTRREESMPELKEAKEEKHNGLHLSSPADGPAARKELAAKTQKKKNSGQAQLAEEKHVAEKHSVAEKHGGESPYEATNAQLLQKLYVEDDWGEAKCAKWIGQKPERCSAPNYTIKCAKSCTKHMQVLAAKEEDKASTSYVGALEAIQKKVRTIRRPAERQNQIVLRVNKIMKEISASIANALKLSVHKDASALQTRASLTAHTAAFEQNAALKAAKHAREEVRKASFDASRAKQAQLDAVKFKKAAGAQVSSLESNSKDQKEKRSHQEESSKRSLREYQEVQLQISRVLAVPQGVEVSPLTSSP